MFDLLATILGSASDRQLRLTTEFADHPAWAGGLAVALEDLLRDVDAVDGALDLIERRHEGDALVDDAADFVVASRRLGVDETSDRVRQAGVRFFAWLMNALTRSDLTDTSNGYRALRASLLADVVDRLVQDQYQTAELLITALGRGWRVAERPTVWHERASGHSKKGTNLTFALRYAGVVLATWWRERRGGLPTVADAP